MNQTIEMICYHDESGNVRPYRFKIHDDTGEVVVVQVRSITDKKEEKIVGTQYLIYYCLCAVNDMLRTFVVRFRKDTCRWYLVKIING